MNEKPEMVNGVVRKRILNNLSNWFIKQTENQILSICTPKNYLHNPIV